MYTVICMYRQLLLFFFISYGREGGLWSSSKIGRKTPKVWSMQIAYVSGRIPIYFLQILYFLLFLHRAVIFVSVCGCRAMTGTIFNFILCV